MARSTKLVGSILLGAGAAYAYGVGRARRGATDRTAPARRYGARDGDIAGLEAASLETETEPSRAPARPRVTRRLIGGALVLYGTLRRGRIGAMARALGFGLLARRGRPARQRGRAARGPERRQVFDIQKTFQIDAPVERVYAFWSHYENFPLFMSHVLEVRDLGKGRSRWRVRGPGGAPIRWIARLTENVPNEMIAWRSEPGAMLEQAGVVRFRPEGTGTRVDLRFCYRPPAQGARRAVTALVGTDPRAKMNEDIGRLKSLLEGAEEARLRPASEGRVPEGLS